MPAEPLISVVVPVRNGAAHLGRCLESLDALDWPRERLEIIVVDNASTDDSAAIASSHGARVIAEPQRGVARARNAGWRASRGDLIAFTDCDCIVSPRWLRALAPAFDDAEIGAAGGRLVPDTPKTVIEEYIIAKDILSQERAMRDDPISPPFLVTANAIYRRAVLDALGGFDDNFAIAGEDADLAWRAQWAGWRLRLIPEAEVIHCHRATLRGFMRQVRSYGAGTSHLFKKHRERLGFRRFTLREPYIEALRGLLLTPIKLITGRTRLERWMPLLDVFHSLGHLRGKLGASLRLRVWNV